MATQPHRRVGLSGDARYSAAPRPLFWLFLSYVLYIYLQIGVRFPTLGDIRLEFLMGLIVGPAGAILLARRSIRGASSVIGWGVALLLVMGLMVALSQFPAASWEIYWNRAIKFCIFGLCIAGFVSNPKDLKWFIGIFLFAFLKMGQEGFTGTLNGSLIWENQEILRLHGATPNYQHPNSFSGTQLGTIPFLYFLYPLLPWYWRAIIVVQTIFCANVVLRTGSRTGYVGAVAAVASIIWLSSKRLKAVAIVLLAIAIITPLIPSQYMGRFESIFEDNSVAGEDTSVGKRKEILVDATEIFVKYPLGVGVGVFPLVRARMFARLQDTHNLYLEVATNLGVQGFIIFCGFILCLWMTLRRLQASFQEQIASFADPPDLSSEASQHFSDLQFMLACARSAWVFLIIRLALGLFGMDLYEVYWWFLAGLCIALIGLNNAALERTRELRPATASPQTRIGFAAVARKSAFPHAVKRR